MNELQQLRDETTQLQTALTIKNGVIEQLKARVAELEAELAKLLAGQESLLLNLADQKRQAVEYREMWAKASERAHSQSSALYARQVPEAKVTGAWESARIGDFNAGWNACRDSVFALMKKAAHMELDTTKRSIAIQDELRALLAAAPAQPAAQDQGEVQSRERWTVTCGHWQDTTLAIHGERTGHIASGIDEDAAHAIVNAHNQGLPPIAAASTGQEVKP